MTYLFVYGTLRRHGTTSIRLALAQDSVFVGVGKFRGRLYDLGRYPGAVASAAKNNLVVGEVYRLGTPKTAFAALDAYEGRRFQRKRAVIRLLNGKKITSWIYLFTGATTGHALIPSGDYVKHLKDP